MLLQFTVGNYRSFREKTTFSLVAEPKERGHESSLLDAQKAAGVKAVSLGVLYGANASGKSNLLQAIQTLKRLAVRGVEPDEPIPVDRFLLGGKNTIEIPPTFLEAHFVIGNEMYCYGLECDVQRIRKEWLHVGQGETPLFDRRTESNGKVFVENYDELARRSETSSERLGFIAEGTRANHPFFAQASRQNVGEIDAIRGWFLFGLNMQSEIRPPVERVSISEDKIDQLGDFLRYADTGITKVAMQIDPLELESLSDSLRRNVEQWIQTSSRLTLRIPIMGRMTSLRYDSESGEVYTSHLRAAHTNELGTETFFDWSSESDGTRRMTELWQMLFAVATGGRTIILDEMERSLHPELMRYLLQQWRKYAPPNTQLIFTTHNDNLLEDDFLRRDEVWFVSKDKTGTSRMVSEVQFKPIEGVTRQRAYLDGMYGGVPKIAERYFHHNPPDLANNEGIK